jgi:hypothetical protein
MTYEKDKADAKPAPKDDPKPAAKAAAPAEDAAPPPEHPECLQMDAYRDKVVTDLDAKIAAHERNIADQKKLIAAVEQEKNEYLAKIAQDRAELHARLVKAQEKPSL